MLDQTDAARCTAAAETQFAQNKTRIMNERTLALTPEGMPAFLGINREQINHSDNNSDSGDDINSETHVDTANVDTTDYQSGKYS